MELNNLPEEIIFQKILPRVAPEVLLECRLVCKSWYSFICDPLFEKLFQAMNPTHSHLLFVHLNRCASVRDSPPQIFLAPVSKDQLGLQFANPTHALTIPNLKSSQIHVQIANGFLCFHPRNNTLDKNSNIPTIVVNPITRQVITAPKDTSPMVEKFWVATRFGFDPIQNEFKVLQLLKFKTSYQFRVWTVGTKSWRQILVHPMSSDDLEFFETSLACNGICFKGTIYCSYMRDFLVMFNVRYEQFSFIPFPSEYHEGRVEDEPIVDPHYIEVDGRLAVVGFKWDALDLWILKENQASNYSWIRETIRLPYVIESSHQILCPVCDVHKGVILLLPYYLKERKVKGYYYDMEKKQLKSMAFEIPEQLCPDGKGGRTKVLFLSRKFQNFEEA